MVIPSVYTGLIVINVGSFASQAVRESVSQQIFDPCGVTAFEITTFEDVVIEHT